MANHRVPIPGWLDETYMTKVLEKGLKKSNIEVLSLDIKPGSTVGDNYCCQIFRIKVDAKINNVQETIYVIGKLTPESKFLENISEKVDLFHKEAKFFDTVLEKFGKYINTLDYFPKPYHVDFETKSLFMEDLKQSGYEMQPRGKFLNLDQILLTIDALATFHGTTWRLLQEEPNIKDDYLSTFWDGEFNEMSEVFLKNTQDNLCKYADNYEVSEKITYKLKNYSDFFLKQGGMDVFKRKDTNLNVLLHGDAWMNNMLYLYNKDGIPTSVKLIDFQIIFYGSFAMDLQYCIFSSATSEVILNNIDQILESYYLKLKEVAPEIPDLTLERVRDEFKRCYIMGFSLLITFRSFISCDKPPDFEDIMNGGQDEMGFNHPNFIRDMKAVLPFLEKQGIFD